LLSYKLGCVLYCGSEIVTSNSGQIKKKKAEAQN
jgi:hypothetical protein